jgi:hypothetical protein
MASVANTTELVTPSQLVTSSSFTEVFRLFYTKRANTLRVTVVIVCDASTAGSVRLYSQSPATEQVGDAVSVGAGFTGYATIPADVTGIGSIGVTDMQVGVEAKRDFGSGNVRVLVVQAYG